MNTMLTTNKIDIFKLFPGTGKEEIWSNYLISNIKQNSKNIIVYTTQPSLVSKGTLYNHYTNINNISNIDHNIDHSIFPISESYFEATSIHNIISCFTAPGESLIFIHKDIFDTIIPDIKDIKLSNIIIDDIHLYENFYELNKLNVEKIYGFTSTHVEWQREYTVYRYSYFDAVSDGIVTPFTLTVNSGYNKQSSIMNIIESHIKINPTYDENNALIIPDLCVYDCDDIMDTFNNEDACLFYACVYKPNIYTRIEYEFILSKHVTLYPPYDKLPSIYFNDIPKVNFVVCTPTKCYTIKDSESPYYTYIYSSDNIGIDYIFGEGEYVSFTISKPITVIDKDEILQNHLSDTIVLLFSHVVRTASIPKSRDDDYRHIRRMRNLMYSDSPNDKKAICAFFKTSDWENINSTTFRYDTWRIPYTAYIPYSQCKRHIITEFILYIHTHKTLPKQDTDPRYRLSELIEFIKMSPHTAVTEENRIILDKFFKSVTWTNISSENDISYYIGKILHAPTTTIQYSITGKDTKGYKKLMNEFIHWVEENKAFPDPKHDPEVYKNFIRIVKYKTLDKHGSNTFVNMDRLFKTRKWGIMNTQLFNSGGLNWFDYKITSMDHIIDEYIVSLIPQLFDHIEEEESLDLSYPYNYVLYAFQSDRLNSNISSYIDTQFTKFFKSQDWYLLTDDVFQEFLTYWTDKSIKRIVYFASSTIKRKRSSRNNR